METSIRNYKNLRKILGGSGVIKRPINNEFDLIELAREGLSVLSVYSLKDYLDTQLDFMGQILNVTPRTIQRKFKGKKKLNVGESEQAIEVAEVINRGQQVFGDLDTFRKWMETPVYALKGKKPIMLLDTTFGTKMLLDELGRIEHGIFS